MFSGVTREISLRSKISAVSYNAPIYGLCLLGLINLTRRACTDGALCSKFVAMPLQ